MESNPIIGFRVPPAHLQQMQQPNMNPFLIRGAPGMINPLGLLTEKDQKKREFERGLFVSGFQKTLTKEMLYEYFNKVKLIHGLKMPLTKLNENKGFAFIYFGSADDAAFVKKTLDHTIILREKIRVSRIVAIEHTSKMMLRIKAQLFKDTTPAAIDKIHSTYFNPQILEREVERIIKDIFKDTIEVNIVNVPTAKDKQGKKVLNYARVHFYVANLKEAYSIAKRTFNDAELVVASPGMIEKEKNQFEVILKQVCSMLNKDNTFNKVVQAQIYEYAKKKRATVLQIKGIKAESLTTNTSFLLTDELKQFIQELNLQWTILNAYISAQTKTEVWGTITFNSAEDCKAAYDVLKNTRPKFKDNVIYGSMKNMTDQRTVLASTVRDDVSQQQMQEFWTKIASNSKVLFKEEQGKQRVPLGKKLDYFSCKILQAKTVMQTTAGEYVDYYDNSEIQPALSDRKVRKIPRRVVIHFFNDISRFEIQELLTEMKGQSDFDKLFVENQKNRGIKVSHGLGHFKEIYYIKHLNANFGSVKRIPRNLNITGERNQNQGQRRFNNDGQGQQRRNFAPTAPRIDYTSFALKSGGGIPKFTPGLMNSNLGLRPPPLSGSIPQVGGLAPQMGMPRGPPQYNQPPPMGGQQFRPAQTKVPPPMGMTGSMPLSMGMTGSMPPPMGQTPPPMGGQYSQPVGSMQPSFMMPPPMGSSNQQAGNQAFRQPPPPPQNK